MNDITLCNFVYWINEYPDNRGLKREGITVKERFELVLKLKAEFLSKYPSGILTGWN